MFETKERKERVILVGVSVSDYDDVSSSLDELEDLAETAGAVCVGRLIQKREQIHPTSYLGKGKIMELKDLLWETEADGIICDDELSPAQISNLKAELDTKIMDRTLLILDIFAARARSSEGRLQVELAQYKYLLPRLMGMWTHLERQEGAIGTRGPGETQLESDRRHIRRKIQKLREELELALYSSDGRCMVFHTAVLAPKTTRTTQGVNVMALKPKRTVTQVLPLAETAIVNAARYRARSLPVAGAILREEDRGEKQLSLLE